MPAVVMRADLKAAVSVAGVSAQLAECGNRLLSAEPIVDAPNPASVAGLGVPGFVWQSGCPAAVGTSCPPWHFRSLLARDAGSAQDHLDG